MNRRVLLARADAAGDVLLSGPAVRAVAARADHVTYLCGPAGAAAARLLPGVGGVMVERLPWIDPDPEPVSAPATAALVDRLAAVAATEAIIFTSFHQSALPLALLLRLAGVPTVAAVSTDYAGSLLDVRHLVDEDVHEVERAYSLVATLGYRPPAGDDGRLAVRLPPGTPVPGDLPAPPYVVVHPGASVPARAWPARRFPDLVRLLSGAGTAVVVTGGPAEVALTAAAAGGRAAAGATVADLGGRTSLAGLAAVLAQAEAVVVGNTGPAHLAAAVGTPVVSLYAPTVPAVRWRPWRVPHVLLGDQAIGCAGCRSRRCPVTGHPCLDSVTVEEVGEALSRLRHPIGRVA